MAFEIEAVVGALFVIGLWSILFKDTLFYRFTERTFVGVSIGVIITQAVKTIITKTWDPLLKGDYTVLGGLILGILILTRLTKKYEWISRFPVVIMVGCGLALMTRTAMEAQIITQIKPVITSPFVTTDLAKTLGNMYSWVGLVGGIGFFLFATKGLPAPLERSVGYIYKIGRYALMAMLGTYFANILMGRSSMFLERLLFILQTFGIVPK